MFIFYPYSFRLSILSTCLLSQWQQNLWSGRPLVCKWLHHYSKDRYLQTNTCPCQWTVIKVCSHLFIALFIFFLEDTPPLKCTTYSNCGQGGHIEQLERAHEAIAHKTKKKGNHAVEKVVTFKGIIRTSTQIKFPMVTPFRPEQRV